MSEEESKIVTVSFDDLTYGELETFEDIVGAIPDGDDAWEKLPKSKVVLAMGFISAKREDPKVTLDDIRALPVGSIVFAADDEDPTSPE